jgi:signal transduction histidine kinase
MIVILVMILSVYFISKSFYKEHLTEEVEHRIISHSAAMQARFDIDTIKYILRMEQTETVHLILYDQFYSPIVFSDHIPDDVLESYQAWVKEITQSKSAYQHFPVTQYIVSGKGFHIPHVWSVNPIMIDGEIEGYLFIDQDTGEFQKTKTKLIKLLLLMGFLSFIIGLLLTVYLTRKISKPLHVMGKITHQIAKGDFDTSLHVHGDDEVGQLAKDIRLMAKQLKEYRDSRQQFLSNVSHDLRTPLTYIKGYSALMKNAPEINEDQWKRNVDVIYKEATRMEHLVKDLFQLTKLDVGQIKLILEKVELVPWLQSIIESKQLIFDHHGLTCELTSENKNIEIWIDQERMSQVINNLLENSIRYTNKGGSITITVREEKDTVAIVISDTGVGIPEEDLAHIWERFYRVDKSRSTDRGGSGLGLAIVKELVQLHGGEIEAKSILGEGSTFMIFLQRKLQVTNKKGHFK